MSSYIPPDPNFLILENKITVKGFNSHFQQWFVPIYTVITEYFKAPYSPFTEANYKLWPGKLQNLESTMQTYQEPIISPLLNLPAVNSQPQTTNEFLIIPYLIFTMLWDKQLRKALYLSGVINMHQWQWSHRKTEWTGYLEY